MRFCLSLLIFLPLALAPAPARGGEQFAAVAFHDVVDFRGDLDDDAVTVDRLIGFFEWLRANDWTTVSIDDLEAAQLGKKPLPKRAILITFDDGYRSLYTRVYPLALAYRMPIVAAVVGSWLEPPMDAKVRYGNRDVPRAKFISWDEAREMARSGLVEFASHSYAMHRGIRGNPQGNEFAPVTARRYAPGRGYESTKAFRERLADDFKKSRDLMTRELGRAPRTLAWPFGRYSVPALEIAKEAGFQFALTLDPAPAELDLPMAWARYLPTNDPDLSILVSNLRFEDPLPSAQRFVTLDPAALWTGDAEGTDARLGKAIERLRTLGATAVVIDAAVTAPDGRIVATWFPNGQLPMRADVLSRIGWQCQTRAGVHFYVRLRSSAALRTLGGAEKVRALFRDLGIYVPAAGMFIDDAPGLVRVEASRPDAPSPWVVRRIRREADLGPLAPADALALDAFRSVAFFRPGLRLALVGDPEAPDLQPSAIADVTLYPVSPKARAAERIGERMQSGGWLTMPSSRRVGLWFAGARPPDESDLISATRRFQRLGGTIIGWAADDPVRDLPRAQTVGPAVSASNFPAKF